MTALIERTPTDGRVQLWRIAALAFFVGVPAVMLALIVSNLYEASTARDVAARENATLSQIVKQIAKRQTRALTPADTASLYLSSPSASLARAELQDLLTKAVAAAGGHLIEAQFTGSTDAEAAGTIAMQLTLAIGNKGLLDLLYALETKLPLLRPMDLNARVEGSGGSDDVAPIASGRSGLLHVDLTVEGRWRKAQE